MGKDVNGMQIYTSARDIGNIAAGFIVGYYGLKWEFARKLFDKYQSIQSGFKTAEGVSSQNAQKVGYEIGKKYRKQAIKELKSDIKSIVKFVPEQLKNTIQLIKQSF